MSKWDRLSLIEKISLRVIYFTGGGVFMLMLGCLLISPSIIRLSDIKTLLRS